MIQTKPTTDLGGGAIAGKVAVRYYRPGLHHELVPADIQAAAERAHCDVTAAAGGSQEYGDNIKIDNIQIVKPSQSL